MTANHVRIVDRKPSPSERESLVSTAGFRCHDRAAVEIAPTNSVFCVCAEEGNDVVGVGRIVGDGAPGLRPHYFAAFVIDPDGHHIEAVINAPWDVT